MSCFLDCFDALSSPPREVPHSADLTLGLAPPSGPPPSRTLPPPAEVDDAAAAAAEGPKRASRDCVIALAPIGIPSRSSCSPGERGEGSRFCTLAYMSSSLEASRLSGGAAVAGGGGGGSGSGWAFPVFLLLST